METVRKNMIIDGEEMPFTEEELKAEMEKVEDELDAKLIRERIACGDLDEDKLLTQEEVMKYFGITQADLDAVGEVEFE